MDRPINDIFQTDDSHKVLALLPKKSVDAIITDPDYKDTLDPDLLKYVCKGNIIVFCKPENQFFQADQYMFWMKPLSTKNFGASTGRYVEMILALRQGNTFNRLHWSQMTGVYHDILIQPPLHPFEKPLTLLERMVSIFTNRGDLILDLFSGLGTASKAAQNLGRQYLGFEKEHKYVAASRLRLAGGTYEQIKALLQ